MAKELFVVVVERSQTLFGSGFMGTGSKCPEIAIAGVFDTYLQAKSVAQEYQDVGQGTRTEWYVSATVVALPDMNAHVYPFAPPRWPNRKFPTPPDSEGER